MKITLLKKRELKRRGFLPEVVLPEIVAELPEKVEVELERVEFAPLNPRGTRLIFKPRVTQR